VEILEKRFIRSWSDAENQVLTVTHHKIETYPIAREAPVFAQMADKRRHFIAYGLSLFVKEEKHWNRS
jgi:hypothetical protein